MVVRAKAEQRPALHLPEAARAGASRLNVGVCRARCGWCRGRGRVGQLDLGCLQHSTNEPPIPPFSLWGLQTCPSALLSPASLPPQSHSESPPSPLTQLPLHLPRYPPHHPLMQSYDARVTRQPQLPKGDTSMLAKRTKIQSPMPSIPHRGRTTGRATLEHL